MKGDNDLRNRTKRFALQIIRLVSSLPHNGQAKVLGRQVLRSGTSVGANYREAQRARTKAEFVSKVGIVEQEADETLYWLELIKESGTADGDSVDDLIREANELVAIFATIGRRSKQ